MKQIILRAILVAFILPIIWGTVTVRPSKTSDEPIAIPDGFGCSFFDGEGNRIPVHAVKLLVRSEFVYMTLSEIDTIQKYFYDMTRHICPFKHCPMREQLRFHGCKNCKEGSDCYALDMIHWEHPTWTYDECEDWLMQPFTKDSLSIRYTVKERANNRQITKDSL